MSVAEERTPLVFSGEDVSKLVPLLTQQYSAQMEQTSNHTVREIDSIGCERVVFNWIHCSIGCLP